MSTKAVAVAVALTLALVVVALMLTRQGRTPPPAAPPAEAAFSFNPALVNSISVRRADGREERAERRDDGAWVYVARGVEWPAVPPETVASALTALPAELATRAESTPPTGGAVITLGMRGGPAVTLRLAPSALGGRTAAAVALGSAERAALIENSVLDPLMNPGPGGWRVPTALPHARDGARVTLEAGSEALALARVEGAWAMRRPIAARASQPAVAALIDALAGLRVVRFEDRAAADLVAMGITRPTLTVTVESDERSAEASGGVRVRTVTRELIVGGPADPKGDTRFAAANTDGSIIMVVPATAITSLALAPRNYLHPTVIATPPGEIVIVTIADTAMAADPAAAQRGYRREGSGWTAINPDGTRRPADAAPIEELLRFLSERPGEPEPFRPDDDIRTLRRIELVDAEGDAREVLTGGYTADGLFALRSGNLLVTFRAVDAPSLLAMPPIESLPPEPGAPSMPSLPAGAPPPK